MSKHYTIGLDIGGSKILAGLVLNQGKVIKKIQRPTQSHKDATTVIKNIIKTIQQIWIPGVKAIGIGAPGQVDHQKGIVFKGPNLPKNWLNIPLAQIIQKQFKVPTIIDNDAHCFTLAESIFGAAKKYHYVIGLTLGTGIGGGIVIKKKLYRGWQNTAGEFGHMVITDEGRCSCRKIGHFEAVVSSKAMVKHYQKLTAQRKTTFEIIKMAEQGNKMALLVIQSMREYLSIGLANIIHTLGPEIIVIGGGLSKIPLFLNDLSQKIKKRVLYPSLKNTKIVKSQLKEDAGILGAALIANSKFKD